uniref:Uncharacterized protein n=1 Tax=Globodera pallida TaxID=36090 RepID=A0A183C9I5_GLOPA
MALFQFVPIPNYISHFPYRQLIIAKAILILSFIFRKTKNATASEKPPTPESLSGSARWAPICNLLSLLWTAIAAWFMLQKFFWAKLDICLSLASFLFTFLALLFSSHFYIVDAQLPGLLFASDALSSVLFGSDSG